MIREKINTQEKTSYDKIEKMKDFILKKDEGKTPFKVKENTYVMAYPEDHNDSFKEKWGKKHGYEKKANLWEIEY